MKYRNNTSTYVFIAVGNIWLSVWELRNLQWKLDRFYGAGLASVYFLRVSYRVPVCLYCGKLDANGFFEIGTYKVAVECYSPYGDPLYFRSSYHETGLIAAMLIQRYIEITNECFCSINQFQCALLRTQHLKWMNTGDTVNTHIISHEQRIICKKKNFNQNMFAPVYIINLFPTL